MPKPNGMFADLKMWGVAVLVATFSSMPATASTKVEHDTASVRPKTVIEPPAKLRIEGTPGNPATLKATHKAPVGPKTDSRKLGKDPAKWETEMSKAPLAPDSTRIKQKADQKKAAPKPGTAPKRP